MFPEEGWHSMDLCAEMLLDHWSNVGSHLAAERLCPKFRRAAGRMPWWRRQRVAWNTDRLVNRWVNYPLFLRRRSKRHELFHVADHSYAHLVHSLPAERTGVYCHDLDAFRCLLLKEENPRPRWFRAMMGRVLTGLQQAAVVFYSTHEVRRQIDRHSLLDPARLIHAPYGIAPEFVPAASEALSPEIARLVPADPFLLHVGSCIPRKRIDVLLDVLAAVRRDFPELRLVQVGGEWTPAQLAQIETLGLGSVVVQLRGLARPAIAELYRRASVLLQPSEAEGFGMPVIEALACGGVVVASDIPVLREVGGPAAVYCPVADVPTWSESVSRLVASDTSAPDSETRRAHAELYSWRRHTQTIKTAYERLLGIAEPPPLACA